MQNNAQNNQTYRVRINNYIRVPQVRVILSDGSNGGIMDTYLALKLAKEEGLDLVEINPRAVPPVVRIVDYGKLKYEEKKKQAEAKKNQKTQELKEITFRPNTDENDLMHKCQQAKGFLEDGDKVKFTIRFRGREVTHPQVGKDKLDWMFQQLVGLMQPNPLINMEGKFMTTVIYPIKHSK